MIVYVGLLKVEMIHIGVGSDVVCSTLIGNARASVRGMGSRRFHAFFMSRMLFTGSDIQADMNALLNAHTTTRGCESPPHIGLTSDVSPKAECSDTGVSSEYARQEGHNWFVIRATYNRLNAAVEKAKKNRITTYVPMHYVQKIIVGKKKRILQPLLPNLLFIYSTREEANKLVIKNSKEPSFIKFYLDRTRSLESNGKNPPLKIPYDAMINFIKATSTKSEHVRIVTDAQCRYKSGDMVKVTAGDFEGVTGRVARIAGQQRVVVEISGLCLVATAYIPSAFLEKMNK